MNFSGTIRIQNYKLHSKVTNLLVHEHDQFPFCYQLSLKQLTGTPILQFLISVYQLHSLLHLQNQNGRRTQKLPKRSKFITINKFRTFNYTMGMNILRKSICHKPKTNVLTLTHKAYVAIVVWKPCVKLMI